MASASVSAGKTAMPVTTVTLKGIVEQLADGHDLPKKQANALVSGMIETMTTHLKSGDRIRISGIGTLESANARRGPAAIQPPARSYRSPRARRWPFAQPRS